MDTTFGASFSVERRRFFHSPAKPEGQEPLVKVAAMKGGPKKKATADVPSEVVEPSGAADSGGGEGGSGQVEIFEGNEGTQLRNGEDEEPQVEDSEGEGEEGEGEGEEEYGLEGDEEEENVGGTFPGAQGVILAENFYEVEAIRRKRVRKVKSSHLFLFFGHCWYCNGDFFSCYFVCASFICNGYFAEFFCLFVWCNGLCDSCGRPCLDRLFLVVW